MVSELCLRLHMEEISKRSLYLFANRNQRSIVQMSEVLKNRWELFKSRVVFERRHFYVDITQCNIKAYFLRQSYRELNELQILR